jgi:hypothetical protein
MPQYDAVVSPTAGLGDYQTIQAADDAVGSGSIYVKNGSYTENLTFASNNAAIFVEPGTTITGTLTISGNEVEVLFGSGCTVTGLITISGTDNWVKCENGGVLSGISVTGARNLFEGGGWDTLVDGATAATSILVSGDDCIVQNARAQTTAGSGNAYNGVGLTGSRDTARLMQVVDSDNNGISPGTDSLIEGCIVLAADASGMWVNARCRIIGNYVTNDVSNVINIGQFGDDTVAVANIAVTTATNGNAVQIHANAEDCVVVGNRTQPNGTGSGVSDSSGTSTVASNDETA